MIGAASLRGDRPAQEDRCLALRRGPARLLLAADGLGGHDSGQLAASIMKGTARELFQADPAAGDLLPRLFQLAWERIDRLNRREGTRAQTTAAVAALAGGALAWAHVGDARCYLMEAGGRVLIRTRDHSLTDLAVAGGELSEEEARRHPDRSVLYRTVGGDRPPKPVFYRRPEALEPGQMVIVCTDGFWEGSRPEEIYQLWRRTGDLPRAVRDCCRRAVAAARGQADNVTAAAYVHGL